MNQKQPRRLKKIGERVICNCGCGNGGVVIQVRRDVYEILNNVGSVFDLRFHYVHDENEYINQVVNKPEGY